MAPTEASENLFTDWTDFFQLLEDKTLQFANDLITHLRLTLQSERELDFGEAQPLTYTITVRKRFSQLATWENKC